jgi:hypothetical protein
VPTQCSWWWTKFARPAGAPTLVFLVSDESQFLTDQVLMLNGEQAYVM